MIFSLETPSTSDHWQKTAGRWNGWCLHGHALNWFLLNDCAPSSANYAQSLGNPESSWLLTLDDSIESRAVPHAHLPRSNQSGLRPPFLITVDTECDDAWTGRR